VGTLKHKDIDQFSNKKISQMPIVSLVNQSSSKKKKKK